MRTVRPFYFICSLSFGLLLASCAGSEPPPTLKEAPPVPATNAPLPTSTAPIPNVPKLEGVIPVTVAAAQKKEDPSLSFQYQPEGRRDPFRSVIASSANRMADENLPPLQRKEISELKLIGVVWGDFGFGAIIQTPDGKGYPVRKGTRVGLNHGRVSRITTKEVMVREKYLDIFGETKVREVVMELHPQKEGLE